MSLDKYSVIIIIVQFWGHLHHRPDTVLSPLYGLSHLMVITSTLEGEDLELFLSYQQDGGQWHQAI